MNWSKQAVSYAAKEKNGEKKRVAEAKRKAKEKKSVLRQKGGKPSRTASPEVEPTKRPEKKLKTAERRRSLK
ncbi:hypothetical protein QW180_08065 [Vibrio sinaloensis]|nr:hypothetical protein [Vibrio sinaloensis]